MIKKCSKCKIYLEVFKFSKRKYAKDGLKSICKDCVKKHRLENLEHYNKIDKKSRLKNKEKRNIKSKKYYLDNKNSKKEYDRIYYLKNKEKKLNNNIKNIKIRKLKDNSFKLRCTISSTINKYLKKNNSCKNKKSCLKYLNFTIKELKEHIEFLFEPWMTWENRGIYKVNEWDDNDKSTWKWQLDHIIPQSDLPYTSMDDENFKKCWALSNLRPYSAKQNLLDGINRVRHK